MPARRKVQVLSTFTGFRRGNAVDAAAACPHGAVKSKTSRSGQSGTKKPTTMMFERFTEKAIKVVMLAQEESRRLGHNFVGTEQILLGLIGEATGIAAKVLKQMGVNLKEARTEVEKIIGRGSGFVAVEIPFTPRAKRVLELSLEEARQLGALPCRGALLTAESCLIAEPSAFSAGHSYIGTEHILLGLLREGEGIAARVLESMGADSEKIRHQVCLAVVTPVVEYVARQRPQLSAYSAPPPPDKVNSHCLLVGCAYGWRESGACRSGSRRLAELEQDPDPRRVWHQPDKASRRG